MLRAIPLDPNSPSQAIDALLNFWENADLKVFVLTATSQPEDVGQFYDRLLPALGTPVPIAEDVRVGDRDHQRTGQIWMEVKYDPQFQNAYRHSSNAQPLHTDGSYVAAYPNATLMACEASAGAGGETTFLDGKRLIETLRAEAPQLLAELSSTILPHARSGDRRDLPAVRLDGDRVLLNWNYYCVDSHARREVVELSKRFQQFLQESAGVRQHTIAVKLARGDAVVWKDEEILHGRNAFHAEKAADRFLWKCAIDVGQWR